MRFLRNIPIKRKLTVLTMLTSGVALALACIAFVAYDQVTFRRTMALDLSILTDLYDDNVSSGLVFGDPKSVEETLRSLNAHPHILAAAVYDKNGQVAAQYQRADLSAPFLFPAVQGTGAHFEKDRLDAFRRILLAGEGVGTIYIASDLRELSARFWRDGAILIIVLTASSLVAFLLSRKLQGVISEPVFHLAEVARTVASGNDYSIRAVKQGEDELGQLIDGFNAMLDQIQMRDGALREVHENLEKRVQERTHELQLEIHERKEAEAKLETTHKQLLETSRQAGMAEVATNVLHNVGNVLNSVNVSATLVAETVRRSRSASLGKVVAMLREHQADCGAFITSDPKGKQIPAFLAALTEHLDEERKTLCSEIGQLQKNVEHIKDIVAMQQSYAKVSGVTEIVNVQDLVEDAVRMNGSALERHQVQVIREFEEVPPLTLEKHKVLQILVNLIRNAKYACDEGGQADKRLFLRITHREDRVQIVVVDNGVGIPAENLTRIFNHGFTTRKDGHGFGLHSGALAAKEMGGSLNVQSDGPGRGASFTLELPMEHESTAKLLAA